MDIDPPTKLVDNVYLGCGQEDIEPSTKDLQEKSDLFQECINASSGRHAKAVPSDQGKSVSAARGVAGSLTPNLGKQHSEKNKTSQDRRDPAQGKVKAWQYKMWGECRTMCG